MNAEDRCFCELAPLYALGLLDEQQSRWVEDQIAESPELASELADLQEAVAAISYEASSAPIAPDLKDRLFQQLDRDASPTLPDNVLPFHRATAVRTSGNRRNRWLRLGGAIAAMATIVLLADNVRLRQQVQQEQATVEALRQPSSLTYALKGTENAADASGSLVVNSRQNAIVLLVQNLPELPVGQAYRLWAIPQGATKPLYCGQFTSRATETTLRWSALDAGCSATIAQILVTAESSTAPPVPAGQLVLKGSVVN